MAEPSAYFSGLSTEDRSKLEQIVERFEGAWQRGQRPVIAEYLAGVDLHRTLLLVELIYADLEYCLKAGQAVHVESYLEAYPHLAQDQRAVIELIAREWELRRRHQPDVAIDEYLQRFPQYRDVLTGRLSGSPPDLGKLGRLGSYYILKVLGEGGMGVVYQAEDRQLKRSVAVKALKPVLAASSAARQRFLREAQAMAAVQHDHIVAIYQVGDEHGVPFLVMPLLQGETLASRLKRLGQEGKALPLAEVLRIGREIAEGLAAAHERGLMHRDIKPSNIWLEAGHDRVKILDFGLARVAGSGTDLTVTGALVGTPGYMAPEQARGEPDVGMRSDLFSLGCVLYHLCTGQRPFQGDNWMSVMRATEEQEPAPPHVLVPEVPRDLAATVMKLLAKDPSDRYQSAREVARLLDHYEQCRQRTPLPDATPVPVSRGAFTPEPARNPFVWRSGITEAAAFFDRGREQRLVRDFLHKRQSCQLVGPRRIGKTSLLLQVERVACRWETSAVVAYLDLQLPQCFTLSGWLRRAGRQFGWQTPPTDLAGFAECVEEMLATGRRPVLCLDEFAELTLRPAEFTRDFFSTLRACGQQGMSILTASDRPLSELTDPTDRAVSPFYNTFPLLPLDAFSEADAADFVALHRPSVPFSPEEQALIAAFARRHPLALHVVCFHMVEARENGEPPTAALQRAEADMKAHLPTW